ncbi:MAG TPA: hypothetical protein VFJ02_17615 [Vicinamibacterales bacterium]|nr:hypothetical protein [Vicinamibacterales bacterium]
MSRLLARCTFDRLLLTLVFLTIVVACALTPMQGDSWWQLRAGRDMWTSGTVMLSDVYSHTWYGTFWVNHEWLAEVVYYVAYAAAGLPGVTLLAAALIVAGWSLAWRLTEGSTRQAFFLVLLSIPPASTWWEPRPHAFSLLFIPATVFLIARERFTWLPAMFVIWANCHGGVLLGFVLMTAALAAHVIARPAAWKRAAVTVAGCALAMTATPLGVAFWTEIPRSLARIRLYPYDEWKRPELWDPFMVPFWLVAIFFAVAMIVYRREVLRRVPAHAPIYACALMLLPLAIMAKRNVSPFLMMAVPALTVLLPRRADAHREAGRRQEIANFAIMTAAVAIVTSTVVWAYYHQIPRLRWEPVPAPAIAALERCPGNLYNRYDEGGELLWFVPSRKVFVDGRQDPFPPAFVLEHIRMEQQGADFRPAFARHDIRCAYLPTFSPTAAALANAGWTTLYQDNRRIVLRVN